MMLSRFETERLLIRSWQPQQDAVAAFAIYGDPQVMRFIRPPDQSVEAVQRSMETVVARYAELNNGTGSWAIVEKATDDLVGAVLLKQLPDNDGKPTQDYEVGWHLRRASWGRGYATEAGRVLLEYGFNRLGRSVIYAVAKAENTASLRVMQRLHMQPKGRVTCYYGEELELYQLDAAEFHLYRTSGN
jgi:[ribosomal protein S5]-alanine N-acetyltransferase